MVSYDRVWSNWVSTSATTYTITSDSSAYGTTTDAVWSQWVADTGTTSSITNNGGDYIWYRWVSGTGEAKVTGDWKVYSGDKVKVIDIPAPPQKSTEQLRAELMQTRINAEWRLMIANEHREEKEEAENTAKALLLDLIGETELKVYEETGRLFVKGRKYDYIVQRRGKVMRIEKDKITDLCIHLAARYRFPETDNVIALKLAIEADEDFVLREANNHGAESRPTVLPRAACM